MAVLTMLKASLIVVVLEDLSVRTIKPEHETYISLLQIFTTDVSWSDCTLDVSHVSCQFNNLLFKL